MMQPVFLLPQCEAKGVVEAGAILLESGEVGGLDDQQRFSSYSKVFGKVYT